MDEPSAWISQAWADWRAAERCVADEKGLGRCHAVAKWQQTVEKAVKSLICALHAVGILQTGVIARHEVERYVSVLVRLPRAHGHRTIQQQLHGLLDQATRDGIRVLDGLAPQMPPRRNTEYPFQTHGGQWTYPAAEGVFGDEEVAGFRQLAHRILNGAARIVSASRRAPR